MSPPDPAEIDRPPAPTTVHLIGAGPGAADLVTVRGWRLLQQADVVVHDALVEGALLAGLDAECIDAGKRAGNHGIGQDAICALLCERARSGQRVVRLKGGDPFVLGRGFEEVLALRAAGVPCEVVPGVSSATAAPLLGGIPLTYRGLADAFAVVSAHPRDDGDLPALPAWHPRLTLIVLMGAATLPVWAAELCRRGWPPDTAVALISWAGWPQQRVYRTTLAAAPAADAPPAPCVAVLGEVAALGLPSPSASAFL
ncbi:MAG: uroporphyrinogen-III C-methyltransferase [Myxococcales bacterium]|nr:uroporphyrinogen-III C-methyltransferase [Myxococcales bacterium]